MKFFTVYLRSLSSALLLSTFSAAVLADAIITSNTQSFIEYERRDINGVRQISREAVKNINIGDHVVFVNFIQNSGDVSAHNFSITSEIPVGSILMTEGVTLNDNVDVTISNSGNAWFPWELASGNLNSTRYINWTVKKLGAGESIELAFKISVKGSGQPSNEIIETTKEPQFIKNTEASTVPAEKVILKPTTTPSTPLQEQPAALPTQSLQRTAAPLSNELQQALEQQLEENNVDEQP